MKFIKGNISIERVQWLVWVLVFLLLVFTLLPMDGFAEAATFSFINTCFYAIIIYGNISFLFPRFYETGQLAKYIIFVIILLLVAGLLRGYLSAFIYNTFFTKHPEPISVLRLMNFVVAGCMTLALSFIIRIAIAYFTLRQKTQEIMVQKSQAELNLLKSQVQPHFLFNTLNNIYYQAYREAPRTAILIERLSNIMRYFVDESFKDEVTLANEIQFIENYIELERIRIRHGVEIKFIKDCNIELNIPPMLLMTFVENIFKHGIDKSSRINKIEISLTQRNNFLLFETKNPVYHIKTSEKASGFGIENLRKRLTMLYATGFELNTDKSNQHYTAFLKIPLS